MTREKRPRGRPRGSGKDDSPHLAQVADLLARDPSLKPTTAMKRVMCTRKDWGASDATLLRRWQVKWKKDDSSYLAAARQRLSNVSVKTGNYFPLMATDLMDVSHLQSLRSLGEASRRMTASLQPLQEVSRRMTDWLQPLQEESRRMTASLQPLQEVSRRMMDLIYPSHLRGLMRIAEEHCRMMNQIYSPHLRELMRCQEEQRRMRNLLGPLGHF